MEITAAIIARLESLAEEKDAVILQRFFKTGPGEYGEGDRFRGIRVPVLRRLCREFAKAGLTEVADLLGSTWHEDRLLALLILIDLYRKADDSGRESIYSLYCSQTARINNWDLVDISAPHIVGRHLSGSDRRSLCRFAASASLWERRIAIISTFYFIRNGEFDDTLSISELLLDDPEDLIHKAVGWMLREVGKRDRKVLEQFLERHGRRMPRIMLRYAIEKFPAEIRQEYLDKSRKRSS